MRKLFLTLIFLVVTTANAAAPPETIVSLMRPKPGKEAALIEALRNHRKTLERLDAVIGPYWLYRGSGEEDGKPILVEIFTWKSGDIPDNAPPEILKGWALLESLVEKRNGRRGIEFYAIEPVADASTMVPSPSK